MPQYLTKINALQRLGGDTTRHHKVGTAVLERKHFCLGKIVLSQGQDTIFIPRAGWVGGRDGGFCREDATFTMIYPVLRGKRVITGYIMILAGT